MKRKRMIFFAMLLLLFVIMVIAIWCYRKGEHLRFAEKLGNGINLGNSLDATNLWDYKPQADELDYEEFWNNPKITREQLQAIADAGFRTVRIPVTWEDHIDEEGQISPRWMKRVREVVDMALDEGLYVILNTHHEDWLDLQVENEETITSRFEQVWRQIATSFKDYDEQLLFESMNEPRLRDSDYEWNAGTEELRAMVNRLNAAFVEMVRSSGGYNEERYLVICPYATNNLTDVMEDLDVPSGKIMVSIHLYEPYHFCQDEDGTAVWSAETESDVKEMEQAFKDMYHIFVRKGIPVLVTEIGCKDKNNIESRIEWLSYVKEMANKQGIGIFWWDNGKEYRLLDRENGTWVFPELVEVLTDKNE